MFFIRPEPLICAVRIRGPSRSDRHFCQLWDECQLLHSCGLRCSKCRYARSVCLGRPIHHVTVPASSPKTTGMRALRLASRPSSSTEKAGVPIADVQRSQLETPPLSPQPQAIRNRKATRNATTPINTESRLRDVALIALTVWLPHPRRADPGRVAVGALSAQEC